MSQIDPLPADDGDPRPTVAERILSAITVLVAVGLGLSFSGLCFRAMGPGR